MPHAAKEGPACPDPEIRPKRIGRPPLSAQISRDLGYRTEALRGSWPRGAKTFHLFAHARHAAPIHRVVGERSVLDQTLEVWSIHAVFDRTGEARAHLGLVAVADGLDEEIPERPALELELAEHVEDLSAQGLARFLELLQQSAIYVTLAGLLGHQVPQLFAALNVLDGKVIGECYPRHRHQEWLKFLRRLDREFPQDLQLHLVMDNYGTHQEPHVKAWLKQHPRFVCHFVPTSSSWLNLVERWFRELSEQAIRHGSFMSVSDLQQAIDEFTQAWNQNPKPFIWTATVGQIIEKVDRARVKMEQIKPGSTLPRGKKKKG
jgi:transposase